MNKLKNTIWISAGGTGGHISPGVALAESFLARKWQVVFFTLEANLNYPDIVRLSARPGGDMVFYNAPKMPKTLVNLRTFFPYLLNSYRSIRRMHRLKAPLAVIGMGGYPSFPPLLYARLHGLSYYLCEQNAVAGFITRLMAKKAQRVFLSFPLVKDLPNSVVSGNPLRPAFQKSKAARGKKKISSLLLLGGSQGASHINALYLAMIDDPFFARLKIVISTGQSQFADLQQQSLARQRKQDKIFAFIEDMPTELARADLVISRSGSGLLFEIMWAHKPAILLPYPFATANHQRFNALELGRQGLAAIVDIRPFAAEQALLAVKEVLQSDLPQQMQKNYQQAVLPLEAHQLIVQTIEQQLKGQAKK